MGIRDGGKSTPIYALNPKSRYRKMIRDAVELFGNIPHVIVGSFSAVLSGIYFPSQDVDVIVAEKPDVECEQVDRVEFGSKEAEVCRADYNGTHFDIIVSREQVDFLRKYSQVKVGCPIPYPYRIYYVVPTVTIFHKLLSTSIELGNNVMDKSVFSIALSITLYSIFGLDEEIVRELIEYYEAKDILLALPEDNEIIRLGAYVGAHFISSFNSEAFERWLELRETVLGILHG